MLQHRRGLARTVRAGVAALSATALIGVAAPSSSADIDLAKIIGQWTEPFEEGGAATPRCVDDGTGYMVCKPRAYAASVLPDGTVYYYNGIEGQENAQDSTALSTAPTARNSQSRILDLTSGTPEWSKPLPERATSTHTNPDYKEGHQSYDDPMAAVGVPGRPGDGFVGSTWGKLGGPPHDPTSSPDDTSDNDGDLFCGELITLADGRLLAVGGTDWYNEPSIMDRNDGDPADVGLIELEGLRSTSIFNWKTGAYEPAGAMKYGRWYPAGLTLPDGKAFITSGVTQLISDTQLGQVRRSETFDPATNAWTENYVNDRSELSMPLFPRLTLAPNGKIFWGGNGQSFNPFGQDAEEAMWSFQYFFDTENKEWEMIGPAPLGARSTAIQVALPMSAPYDKMTLLSAGGTLGPTPGSYVGTPLSTITTIDSAGNVSNELAGNPNAGRWFGSGIPLPDGNVMIVGGSDLDETIMPGAEKAIRTPEIYDVRTDKWTKIADQSRDRSYHHTALLLPDMRVLLGGSVPVGAGYGGPPRDQPMRGNNDADPSFEVYSPPYLMRGDRPTITSAQAGVDYGKTFTVGTPDADEIDSVILMRMPSVQHTIDGDQRTLVLPFTQTGEGTLEATVPPNAVAAPPGVYYLVVNRRTADGPIPSVARIVNVGLGTDTSPAPDPYGRDAAVVGAGVTPDPDSSSAAQAQQSLLEATQDTPAAPVAQAVSSVASAVKQTGEAAANPAPPSVPEGVATLAGKEEEALTATPTSRTSPLRQPAVPAAAAGVLVAMLAGRRGLRRYLVSC